jgi:RsiW-degrading membrane proteinase PrsW (M82 family)
LYALLIALAAGRARERAALFVATFFAGAVLAGGLATTINALLPQWAAAVTTPLQTGPFDPMFAVPAVEELAKGAALLVVLLAARRRFFGVRDGIACGAIVGLGFAASENVLYLTLAALQGGYTGLLQSTYLRSFLYGLNHAVFTATTGAGLALAREGASRVRTLLIAIAGWCAAVAEHFAWNMLASEKIVALLCEPAAAGESCRVPTSPWNLYVVAPAMVALFVGPAAAALLLLARRTHASAPSASI